MQIEEYLKIGRKQYINALMRVRFLKQRRLNKRTKLVLKNKVHLDSLSSHEKYVLVLLTRQPIMLLLSVKSIT